MSSCRNILCSDFSAGGIPSKPLLFPCGNLRRETLPRAMEEAGIPLKCLMCYKTVAEKDIEQTLRKMQVCRYSSHKQSLPHAVQENILQLCYMLESKCLLLLSPKPSEKTTAILYITLEQLQMFDLMLSIYTLDFVCVPMLPWSRLAEYSF